MQAPWTPLERAETIRANQGYSVCICSDGEDDETILRGATRAKASYSHIRQCGWGSSGSATTSSQQHPCGCIRGLEWWKRSTLFQPITLLVSLQQHSPADIGWTERQLGHHSFIEGILTSTVLQNQLYNSERRYCRVV